MCITGVRRGGCNRRFCVYLPPFSLALATLADGSWMQETGRRLLSQIGLPVRSACPYGWPARTVVRDRKDLTTMASTDLCDHS